VKIRFVEHQQVGSGDGPYSRGAPRPSQDCDLAKEMARAKADVPPGERNVHLATGDEIHRMGLFTAARNDMARIDRLRSQQPHDVGDCRGIEPGKQGHSQNRDGGSAPRKPSQ
jgi:hypothetical protein